MKKLPSLILLLFILQFVSVTVAAEIPYLTGRVNDTAHLLSPETRQSLGNLLKNHEEQTGNQIVVLTLSTLAGESIERYAVRVFEAWKPGQKGKDNGVLLIVVPNDRIMRIEVGYGLEPVLTDLTAGRIIQQIMAPRFKAGDFDGGISEGVLAIVKVLEGEMLPVAEESVQGNKESGGLQLNGPDLSLKERILLGTFIFGIIGLFTIIGIVTPGSGWFLYLFLIPFWAMFPMVVVGINGALICLGSYLVLFPLTKLFIRNTAWYKKAKVDLKTKGRASIGGFTLGGSSGGFSSGGSGGFSGGGGSSGGGGASGSW